MEKNNLLALYCIGVIVLAFIDQLSQLAVLKFVRQVETIPLIENVFHSAKPIRPVFLHNGGGFGCRHRVYD